jgi:putative hydrolase
MSTAWVNLREDWHVHSTFSDGTSSVDENIQEAVDIGLSRLMLVDHVRIDTPWVAEFAAAVAGARISAPRLDVACGVEAKLLATDGSLDMPMQLPDGVRIVVADHQVPTPGGPAHPREVRAGLEAGDLDPQRVVGWIVDSTVRAIERHPHVLVAHLFSVLPKIGLNESAVTGAHLGRLAAAAVRHDAVVEISERWRCPGARAVVALRSAGVQIVASTDSHARTSIGRYGYVADLAYASSGIEEAPIPARM